MSLYWETGNVNNNITNKSHMIMLKNTYKSFLSKVLGWKNNIVERHILFILQQSTIGNPNLLISVCCWLFLVNAVSTISQHTYFKIKFKVFNLIRFSWPFLCIKCNFFFMETYLTNTFFYISASVFIIN